MLNNVRKHNVRKPGKPPEGGGHLTILYPYIYIYVHKSLTYTGTFTGNSTQRNARGVGYNIVI